MIEKPKRKPKDIIADPNRMLAYGLIGGGGLLLLTSILSISIWQLWPVLLIGAGVLLLFGRITLNSTARYEHVCVPLEDTESADVDLHLSVGEAQVHMLTGSDQLLDANVSYVGDLEFTAEGDQHKQIRLRPAGGSSVQWINPANWFSGQDYRWQVGLSRDIPLALSIHGGVGDSQLDLRGLRLDEFNLYAGVGEAHLKLPEGDYEVRVQGGLGEVYIDLPRVGDIDLDVKGGVGEVHISTPPDAALYIEAQPGMGEIRLPPRLTRVSGNGEGKGGVWESPDFHSAAQRIRIRYTGGMGELKVR